jgi:peptidoglycan LD-endopeptidase CwlK
VVHLELAEDVRAIFNELYARTFPIQKMVAIVAYGWDDDRSMADNNTSAFNYRLIFGTDRLSNHSFGREVDINPMQNPYVRRDREVVPPGSSYDLAKPGTITGDVVALFKSYGWAWGGDWKETKDFQHFEKLF